MATGELLSCYCLTEPGAGSDANSGKTKAVKIEPPKPKKVKKKTKKDKKEEVKDKD